MAWLDPDQEQSKTRDNLGQIWPKITLGWKKYVATGATRRRWNKSNEEHIRELKGSTQAKIITGYSIAEACNSFAPLVITAIFFTHWVSVKLVRLHNVLLVWILPQSLNVNFMVQTALYYGSCYTYHLLQYMWINIHTVRLIQCFSDCPFPTDHSGTLLVHSWLTECVFLTCYGLIVFSFYLSLCVFISNVACYARSALYFDLWWREKDCCRQMAHSTKRGLGYHHICL